MAARSSCGATSGRPLQFELLPMDGAVSEVQIDDVLVGHAKLGSESFKVGHRCFVEADCNGLFEPAAIGVRLTLHFGEIILSSHHYLP